MTGKINARCRARHHVLDVEIEVSRAQAGDLEVILPRWVPGAYLSRPFARGLTNLSVSAGNLERKHIGAWTIVGAPATLTITYNMYARDLSPHGLFIDDERGFLDLGRALLAVRGMEDAPHAVEVEVPLGFRVETSLPKESPSYRAATDHPVIFARDLEVLQFDVGEVEHTVALSGLGDGAFNARFDRARLSSDLKKVCRAVADIFGTEPPSGERGYRFLISLVSEGYGGLEHADSTHCIVNRLHLPTEGLAQPSVGYRMLLGLLSHEYMHAWWVKRVRPKAIADADLTAVTPTTLLWLFEGFTAYYDDLVLVRAGVIEPASYLELLAQQITRVWQAPGSDVRSVADASFDAWLFPGGVENQNNVTVSYYAKGAMVALALDLTLRLSSEGEVSLDDVMRAFWRARAVPIDDEHVPRIIASVAPESFDVEQFMARFVWGNANPPVLELLQGFGVRGAQRARRGLSDRGGALRGPTPARAFAGPSDEAPVRIGAVLTKDKARLASVQTGGPADRAGLVVGDELVALDGERVTYGRLFGLIARYRPRERARVHFFRDGRLREVVLEFEAPPEDVCALRVDAQSDEDELERRVRWMKR